MAQVWSDVVVGEHVVFQSIKEIRQVFEPAEVIKTVPKQGYTWIHDVQELEASSGTKSQSDTSSTGKKALVLSLSGLCLALIFALIWVTQLPQQKLSGSLVILPVNDNIKDADHHWVKLGAMDQLIQQLASGEHTGVLHTDYVLEIMERANTPLQGYSSDDIANIFTVSGASLIVETTLMGVPQDYKLLYTLFRQTSIKKGVVFAKSIPAALEKLANIIAHQSGLNINPLPADYGSGFSNEIIANALLAQENNDIESTIKLLEAVVAKEKSNLTAKRLLIEKLMQQGEIERAGELLQDAFKQLKALDKPNREQVRISFFAAVNEIQKMNISSAETLLDKTEILATDLNEWLYLGYIAETRGKVAQHLGQYQRAEQFFQQAISYHQVLHCPYGESNGLLNLSILADEQGLERKAQAFLNEALTKTRQHQLIQVEKRVQDWQRQLAAK
ncbi:hypothetical protein MACH26_14000 [Planctobacterium marinum]|uniref:Uncharacterized protein n=2 Tax=Planctobacterium marinum TaxID=1631968 RepID=A0AA48HQ05_9ALTE|nr:hypothetical protein MACH26_14000 [Planctobacterium marinum]